MAKTLQDALDTASALPLLLEQQITINPAVPDDLQQEAQSISDQIGELYQKLGALV